MTRDAYTYVVLRYRHDRAAGELINVGVVLHEPTSGFLKARMRRRLGRVAKVFPDISADDLRRSLRRIEIGVARASSQAGDLVGSLRSALDFARLVLPEDDSSFVWSELGSGLTGEPSETLDRLYDRFVARYDEPSRSHRDDAAIWRPVNEMLCERKLAVYLQPKVISSDVDSVEFDHAWKNSTWHCYQPLSFDLANEENIREKARRWTGHMMALASAAQVFKPYFVVGIPSDEGLIAAYRDALRILELSPVAAKIVEEAEIPQLVADLEDAIRAHGTGGSH